MNRLARPVAAVLGGAVLNWRRPVVPASVSPDWRLLHVFQITSACNAPPNEFVQRRRWRERLVQLADFRVAQLRSTLAICACRVCDAESVQQAQADSPDRRSFAGRARDQAPFPSSGENLPDNLLTTAGSLASRFAWSFVTTVSHIAEWLPGWQPFLAEPVLRQPGKSSLQSWLPPPRNQGVPRPAT